LPIQRGKTLTHEDHIRKWVIHTLMCDFELDKKVFQQRYHIDFDIHFIGTLECLKSLEKDGLMVNTPEKILITPLGELFVRMIAMTFDAYIPKTNQKPQFSQSI
jgi:oxygen-independent coproporphyrinogen-3 oxidase